MAQNVPCGDFEVRMEPDFRKKETTVSFKGVQKKRCERFIIDIAYFVEI